MFRSLQAKLLVAFAGVVVVALGLSATVFILLNRNDREQREIDRVASASPSIVGEYVLAALRSQTEDELTAFTRDAAKRYDVRVILVDQTGKVLADNQNGLVGRKLDVPQRQEQLPGIVGRQSYQTWKPTDGAPGAGYVLLVSNVPAIPASLLSSAVAASGSAATSGPPSGDSSPATTATGPGGRQNRVELPRLVIGVEESTIANAWISLLPGLGIAAAIALPVAALFAILLARYITRPVKQLTLAAHQMTGGTFDIQVPNGRRDELGDLTEAFVIMARHVGATHSQMRNLVANVSHDLKTPLTSIRGFARALHTGTASGPDAERAGAIIEEEAVRLSDRLDDLLLLSELDSGKAVVEREEIDLSRLAQSAVRRTLEGPDPHPFVVQTDIAPEVVAVADGAKLERVVENLLDNARKFTTEGVVSVTVRSGTNGTAELEVANTCPTVDGAELERLFERFYRRDRSRSARNGTGLGLAIARDLAELQGGTLRAAHDSGLIRFQLSLPAPA